MRRDDPIIYFAGPSQHSWCQNFKGLHVLESFANLIDEEANGNMSRYRNTFASMALDPGAFSNMTARRNGKQDVVCIERYIEYAVQHGRGYRFCAHFDDIEGGADGNRSNWLRCRDAGVPNLMAVFHQGEPFSLLDEYIPGSDYIGLGFQRLPNGQIDREKAAPWLDRCFSRIPSDKWVHIFAGTDFMEWPCTSADSTTWMVEVHAILRHSSQGRDALRFLTQPEVLTDIVLRKYEREWKQRRWDGPLLGVAAGRGEQVDLEELLREIAS